MPEPLGSPPPGAPAPVGLKMVATDTTGAIMQAVGTLVVAPVAPALGPIPPGVDAVVVAIKSRWQSSEFITALGVILTGGMDAAFNGILPLLSAGPVDAKAVKLAFVRGLMTGLVGAFLAYRRASSNSVVR